MRYILILLFCFVAITVMATIVQVGGKIVQVGGKIVTSDVTVSPPAYTSYTNGLVAYWKADNATTDCFDSVDAVTNVGMTYVSGKINQAFHFDGSDDYVSYGTNEALRISTNLTIACWVKLFISDQNKGIVQRYYAAGSARAWGLFTDADASDKNLTFQYQRSGAAYNAGDHLNTPAQLPTNVFQHVACVFQGGVSATIYTNGILSTQDVTDIQATIANVSAECVLGRSTDGPVYANVDLDEVGIWKTALSAAQISQMYADGNTGIGFR